MKKRCVSSMPKTAKNYRDRGITVCSRWNESFEEFLKDLGRCPPGHTLDRIDTSKGYFKENCRWASRREQQRNRRVNRLITHNGETLTVAEWSERTGLADHVILKRLDLNWPIAKTLSEPVKQQARLFTVNGATKSLADLSRTYQVPYESLRHRVTYLGWPIEKALTTPVRPKAPNGARCNK
jgi:hypothetical protein